MFYKSSITVLKLCLTALFILAGAASSGKGSLPPPSPAAEPVSIDASPNQAVLFDSPHLLPVSGDLIPELRQQGLADDWIVWAFLAGLFMVAIARYLFPLKVRQILLAVVGLRFFYQLDKDSSFFFQTPTYLLFAHFLAVISLLVFQTLQQGEWLVRWQEIHPGLIYLIVVGLLALSYALKAGLLYLVAWVFQTKRATYVYLKNVFVFNQFAGLLLLPLVFYNAYKPSVQVLIMAWILLGAINAYKLGRGAFLGGRESGFSMYYLFLYLCAVELAPLLVLGKLTSAYLLET